MPCVTLNFLFAVAGSIMHHLGSFFFLFDDPCTTNFFFDSYHTFLFIRKKKNHVKTVYISLLLMTTKILFRFFPMWRGFADRHEKKKDFIVSDGASVLHLDFWNFGNQRFIHLYTTGKTVPKFRFRPGARLLPQCIESAAFFFEIFVFGDITPHASLRSF